MRLPPTNGNSVRSKTCLLGPVTSAVLRRILNKEIKER
jgi:hypothetical protein